MPNMDSWMSSFLLLILASGIGKFIEYLIKNYSDYFNDFSTVTLVIFLLLLILSPIVAIAIVHHLICILLDILSLNSKRRKKQKNRGIFPGLVSWGEGWFGWQALVFTLVVSTALELIFFTSYQMMFVPNYWWGEPGVFFTRVMFIRLIIIAFVYQFEFSIRKYLIALDTDY